MEGRAEVLNIETDLHHVFAVCHGDEGMGVFEEVVDHY
jgi:hypothetical protein